MADMDSQLTYLYLTLVHLKVEVMHILTANFTESGRLGKITDVIK